MVPASLRMPKHVWRLHRHMHAPLTYICMLLMYCACMYFYCHILDVPNSACGNVSIDVTLGDL